MIPVARIRPTTQGRTPERNAFTPLYLRKFLRRAEIIRIMIKEGSTTPNVATIAPKIPA